MESLLSLARAWLDEDPDPETREELRALIEECADAGRFQKARKDDPA